ncbi:LamB/YcsF family protein [Alkalicoccus chagannorensis]|uniref:LamB/YcsF family protein n=1 Tax=Alkalicoccus chagannorensis TaxID=427072 RepID=UPI000429DAEA|nr:5-oxoprolinase subunit PxpA [Alkalicoccus chagannorensis]
MIKVDLNADVGESYGAYTIGSDADLIPLVSSIHAACGFHAGDPAVMRRTTALAAEHGTAVGAHPGYPDLSGFGRRTVGLSPEDIYTAVLYQLGSLEGFCRKADVPMQHVKPHGALYNEAAVSREKADAVAAAAADWDKDLLLYGLAGSELLEAGRRAGLRVVSEVFADRGYQPDGTLMPRTEEGALLEREAALQQVRQMVMDGTVTASDGSVLPIQADSICLHGDKPESPALAAAIREMLYEERVAVVPPGDIDG